MSDSRINDNGPKEEKLHGTVHANNSNAENEFTEKESKGVSWDGEDDELNPMNWPAGKKWGILAVVSLMTFIT